MLDFLIIYDLERYFYDIFTFCYFDRFYVDLQLFFTAKCIPANLCQQWLQAKFKKTAARLQKRKAACSLAVLLALSGTE